MGSGFALRLLPGQRVKLRCDCAYAPPVWHRDAAGFDAATAVRVRRAPVVVDFNSTDPGMWPAARNSCGPAGGRWWRRGCGGVARRRSDSELYASCFRRLVVQLYAVTGDLTEAQEAVQEAFTRALMAPGRFAGLEEPGGLVASGRGELGPQPVPPPSDARRAAAPHRAAAGSRRPLPEHLALLAALRLLPEGQRHALALHYLVDLPVDEVAATLGVSSGTVKSRLSRGRVALAALLADSDATGTGRIDVRS